jgi:hypothetical protein
MPAQPTHLSQTAKGAAVLTALVVETLNESNPSFRKRFLKRLDAAYHSLDDGPRSEARAIEMLLWTREVLLGKAELTDWIKEYKG